MQATPAGTPRAGCRDGQRTARRRRDRAGGGPHARLGAGLRRSAGRGLAAARKRHRAATGASKSRRRPAATGWSGPAAAALVEYDRAERWLAEGIRYADGSGCGTTGATWRPTWRTCSGPPAGGTRRPGPRSTPWPTGAAGSPPEITAQYVLGYLAMGRGDSAAATRWLTRGAGQGEPMARGAAAVAAAVGAGRGRPVPGRLRHRDRLCDRGYPPRRTSATRPTCSRSC